MHDGARLDNAKKILVVDDDHRLRKLERHAMEQLGFKVLEADSGPHAIEAVVEHAPHLMLLDLDMPGMDGFAVCERVREFSLVPIILVTGQDEPDLKVRGLENGADDYVVKPFSPKELSARVKAVLRRSSQEPAGRNQSSSCRCGALLIEFDKGRVTVDGKAVQLTATEYRVLAYMARTTGMVLTPDQLLEHAWGPEYVGEVHLLRVVIARIRKKLGENGKNHGYLQTRAGIGYTVAA